MAGNIQADNNGDILVEFDYNNIIVVDPNKTIDAFGKIQERLVDHENLVMYANLEAEILPRTKLAVGAAPNDRIRTVSVAKINFLKPSKQTYFGTGYYDELTGENSTKFKGENQMQQRSVQPQDGSKAYLINEPANLQDVVDNGLLGITSIEIQTSTSFIPSVVIRLEDVQGRALFQLGNNSPYSAFFNLPYPIFYLTLKGFYGQAVRYQLNLEKFNCNFNSYSGNYQVKLDFKGYKFNILNEISLGHLLAVPHMYASRYDVTTTPVQSQQTQKNANSTGSNNIVQNKEVVNSNSQAVNQVVVKKGYQKIIEVYSEYKAKGLIPQDFPELTLLQLMNKLQNFEKNIASSFPKAEVEPLTNIRSFKDFLKQYFDIVRGGDNSWFNKYLNPRPFILLNSNLRVYLFKNDLNVEARTEAIDQIKNIIDEYTKVLIGNPTVGFKGPSPIPITIKYDTILYDQLTPDKIDWKATTTQQTGVPDPSLAQVTEFIAKNKNLFFVSVVKTDNKQEFVPLQLSSFIFEGDGRFDKQVAQIESQANKKLSEYEASISNKLLEKIQDKATGIGFKPTVRNMIAVIMASSEAFIRLLDEVHTNAWTVKYDPVRKRAILDNPSSAPGSDTRDDVKVKPSAQETNSNDANSQIPVYPWPQFFVETPDDKKGRFQLKYIADPTVVDLTQGYLYDKWPEVEFVEEYLTGITQKFDPPPEPPPLENDRDTNTLNINAIEFPNLGLAYANKEEIKFFYEIWERQLVTSRYSNLSRANQGQINELIRLNVETEVNNIVKGLGISSPYITYKLKNYNLNSNDYVKFLENISNQGTGRSYQDFIRDFYVTPYLRNLTRNSFGLLNILEIGKIPQTETKSDALQMLLTNASNQPLIIDTIPFTNPDWTLSNLADGKANFGNSVYNTNRTLKIFEPRKIISNFNDVYDFQTNRPVTSFCYLTTENPYNDVNSLTADDIGLLSFYEPRKPEDFIPTEGYCFYNSPSNQLPQKTTTSLLNTPYFVNSILNGVANDRRNDPYPYVQSAYLFLNSLPLATLREKYKSLNNNVQEDLDYIASCFKKFGAIHKLPYSWILKLGSNWHRYKKYKETGNDLLTSCWTNFDYVKNYSPISGSTSQTYSFKYNQLNENITLQVETPTDVKMNVGFYPKVISDFSYFYTGFDLYANYTNEEIQNSINIGMKVFKFSESAIQGNQGEKTLNLDTWSVLIPQLTTNVDKACDSKDNTTSRDYFVVPSFGSQVNQTKNACFNNITTTVDTVVPVTSNPSVFNGSVRSLWASPNYGYFDNGQIRFPTYDSYINKIDPNSSNQSPFQLLNENSYSKIEEIFSVFEKRILDLFEDQFLKFCRPDTNIDSGSQPAQFLESTVNLDANYRNFQSLFSSLMTIPAKLGDESDTDYFQNTINVQYGNFINGIKAFMNYDILFKFGNPSNYDRRVWDSYLSHQNNDVVTDPITFQPYVPNSLPSASGGITLQQSKIKNPKAWQTLELEVGFSTIPNVAYSDTGSYITDFFIQNNIEFTSDNVTILASLIKMWATEKLNNRNTSSSVFQNKISTYLSSETTLQNNFLDQVLSGVRNLLPKQEQLPQKFIKSAIQGEQGKAEIYEVFKALNDKWIAGDDFTNKTLFEDILFLDRASRNIGETIILDIFDLQSMFTQEGMNMKMPVYSYISSILIKNNFTVMNLPSYVNFYNVQDVDGTTTPQPEGSLEFANNFWGTFLNVDYRNSSQKMVCFYVGKPSAYLDLPKGNFRFRDDGFELSRASENPLIENQKDKSDWALSNKCVGFNVDVGTRNQNIFYSFSVSQDSGVATSESIDTFLNMVNQSNGRNTATQNVSLYNLYKQRSYKCEVVSLGNAMLQPTMYFNLRHVPMFNGPYFITNVTHTINVGNFQTSFSGIRQGIFDLPSIDNFLQSINQNLLTRLEELLKIEKDKTIVTATTENAKSSQVVQKSDNVKDTSNSCVSNVLRSKYPDYVVTDVIETRQTPENFAIRINTLVPNNPNLALYIYTICYVQSFVATNNSGKGEFIGFNDNFANISLDYDYSNASTFFQKNFCCINVKGTSAVTKSLPFVGFDNVDKFILFMKSRLEPNLSRIDNGLVKYYVCHWPKDNVSESYYESNLDQYTTLNQTFEDAIDSAVKAKLVNQEKGKEIRQNITEDNNIPKPGVTPTPSPIPPRPGQTCPPPVINSFAPIVGNTGTIIQINGSGFQNVTVVKVNNLVVDPTQVTIFNDTTMRVSIPEISNSQIVIGDIVLDSNYGESVSRTNQKFTFDPNLPANNASSPGSYENNANSAIAANNSNTNPQSTGAVVMIGTTTESEPNKTQSLNVKINSETPNWVISPNVTMSYSIRELTINNNEIISRPVKQGTPQITGQVSNNQFNITINDIINKNYLGYTPILGISQIDIVFICRATSTTAQQPVEQQFAFKMYYTVPNQSTVPSQQIPINQNLPTFQQISLAIQSLGEKPNIFGNGPSYYNFRKTGGNYETLQFLLPSNNVLNTDWIERVRVLNASNSEIIPSTITVDSSTYTNLVSVNNIVPMRLEIVYLPYGNSAPDGGQILKQTVLSPIFVLS